MILTIQILWKQFEAIWKHSNAFIAIFDFFRKLESVDQPDTEHVEQTHMRVPQG